MSKTLPFAAAVALFCAPLARAQMGSMDAPAKPPAYVTYAAEAQSVAAGKPAVLELRFQLAQGYHVNSHTPKSELLIPTVLTLQPADGVKPGLPEYPAGKAFSFSFDPTDKLDVYAESFTLKLPFVATPGAHTLDATLKYQACNSASCFPPRTLPVDVVFSAK